MACRCQEGCFSIDSIGFLARSELVTFVAHVLIVGCALGSLRLVAKGTRRRRTKIEKKEFYTEDTEGAEERGLLAPIG